MICVFGLIYCGLGNAEMFYFYVVEYLSFVLWLLGLGLYLEKASPLWHYYMFFKTHLFSFSIFKFSFLCLDFWSTGDLFGVKRRKESNFLFSGWLPSSSQPQLLSDLQWHFPPTLHFHLFGVHVWCLPFPWSVPHHLQFRSFRTCFKIWPGYQPCPSFLFFGIFLLSLHG